MALDPRDAEAQPHDGEALSWDYTTTEIDETRLEWPVDLVERLRPLPSLAPEDDGIRDSDRTPEEVLRRYWGYDTFRPLQREIVVSALQGRDTLGLLPTGGGKSICFQVPGLMRSGITLVITPLISLMKDQVDNLRRRGIKAAAIHSGMTNRSIVQTLDNCRYGRYRFLYISPERLASEQFRVQLLNLDIGLLVIDECHCISQWGYDFRPSYLNILELRTLVPNVPILALTATATPEVVMDIQRVLGFGPESRMYQKSFVRPNLSYSIRHTEERERMMLHILSRVEGSAIVYCRSRDLCREVASYLRGEGVSATFFHAGLTYAERERRQEAWMRGDERVMVATNAFGMGIDKPDVRVVIHLMMPSSLEEYFQEAGRAGRDGERSYAVALVGRRDALQLDARLRDAFPPMDYIRHTYDTLCNYLGIGEGEGFGQSFDFDYEEFVYVYRMRPIQTRSALEILQVAGWLTIHEDETRSRLMFATTRERLYAPEVGHDDLLRALMRLYTGLFSDYVYISELELSRQSGLSPDEVYLALVYLERIGILHYIPRRNVPRIVFHIRREDSRLLHLPPSAYQDRYERMHQRIEGVKQYITDDETCRSRLLVGYFGEQTPYACAACDVCLARHAEGVRHYVVEDVRKWITEHLTTSSEGHIHLSDLLNAMPYHTDDVLSAVRLLTSEGYADWTLLGNLIVRSPQD